MSESATGAVPRAPLVVLVKQKQAVTMDEEDSNPMGTKSPIKRLGSTRKQMFFNSEYRRCPGGEYLSRLAPPASWAADGADGAAPQPSRRQRGAERVTAAPLKRAGPGRGPSVLRAPPLHFWSEIQNWRAGK